MNWKFWEKKEPAKPQSKAREWLNAVTFAVVAATLIRWTTVEAFVIPTPSMENSMLVGDYLFVSKLHYGTRTTGTPLQIPLTHQKIWGTNIPSYLDWIQIPSYRLPGFTHVQREDVVVFNIPPRKLNDGIDYPITLKSNYVKRCVGIPGDELKIRNAVVYANDRPLSLPEKMKFSYLVTTKDEINPRNLKSLELDSDDIYFLGRIDETKVMYHMLLTSAQLEQVKSLPYAIAVEKDYTRNEPDPGIFPTAMGNRWSGNNYGPIHIPEKGLTININDSTLALYGEVIQLYEHHEQVEVGKSTLSIGGKSQQSYTFKQDYYFMMGDNRHNSLDSRYWGFVPADHIVGKPIFIWMSINEEADLLHMIRWNRLLDLIH